MASDGLGSASGSIDRTVNHRLAVLFANMVTVGARSDVARLGDVDTKAGEF